MKKIMQKLILGFKRDVIIQPGSRLKDCCLVCRTARPTMVNGTGSSTCKA